MMSSGCGDSSVNTMGIRGIPEQCGCGRRTGIYTSKTKVNPGRTFFRCPTFQNASNELKKLNVIMKVGFLVVCLGVVICLVLIMFDKADGLRTNEHTNEQTIKINNMMKTQG
ncbi:hypothetical protein HID58_060147 [Brassica napus]|uniref:GRF-type domain-containing protein n=1 Tax=Brassica napus TaxID=3708 RepID=A0ABQ7ZUX1_BRANA|nr:hypothetical protein HID58_060147 [Brassica napus]